MPRRFQGSRPSRRSFLKGSAALGTALAGGALFAPAVHAAKSIKLGYVSAAAPDRSPPSPKPTISSSRASWRRSRTA